MDNVSKEKRSYIMSRIRSVSRLEHEAKPFLRRMGFFRLRHQPKGILGRPDFANKSRKVAVFIQGCYWHQPCGSCRFKAPKSNAGFWKKKFDRNRERHSEVVKRLCDEGWKVVVVWEHEIRGIR